MAMPNMRDVQIDLAAEGGDRAKLMQKYSDEQAAIVKQYGGSQSDIPVNNPEHEYYKLQTKIMILGRL